MASISLPPQSQSGFSQHFDSSTTSSNIDSRNRMSMPAPLPNPPFVFPTRDPDAPDSQLQTQSTESRTPLPLPAFSFNPGASQPSLPTPAPTPRTGGHRRRPSEFVGNDHLVTPEALDFGDKREEPPTPTQPSAPAGPPPGRGPGRRHHAHRRSAAVSGVDLNAIAQALGTNPSAGSAPTTPRDKKFDSSHEDVSRPLSHSAGSLGRPTPPASPRFPPDSPTPPVPPIPAAIQIQPASNDGVHNDRPGTATSVAPHEIPVNVPTLRFENSEELPPACPRPTPDRMPKPRPKTADASLVFDLMQSQNVPEVPAIKRSKSTGHSRSRKSVSTGHLNALADHTNNDAFSTEASRPYSDNGLDSLSDSDNDGDGPPSAKVSRSNRKKKKRVRSWADALLTRGKGKRNEKAETKHKPPALTPPALSRTNSDVGSAMDVDFDNDDVVVLRTPNNPEGTFAAAEDTQEPPLPTPTLETSWKPPTFYEQTAHDQTLSSPVIDLDAALGPFNTPAMHPARGTPSKFSVATQRMYSGGRRGEFVGPEMRYHRRTESAPVMQPFDHSTLGPIRLGGTTVETPDVFYEEEEDAFLAANQSPRGELALADTAVPASPDNTKKSNESIKSVEPAESVESSHTNETMTQAREPSSSQHKGLGIQSSEGTKDQSDSAALSERPTLDAMQDTINPFAGSPQRPVAIFKSEESVPKARGPPSPDVSPGFLAVDKRPSTSPHALPPSIPPFSLSAGVSPSDSSFPSPDAPRAFNDRNFTSHSYHHLPSEYPYASVEDVPSLTSSASTMTNTMNRFSASFFPRTRLSTDRAASFSAAVHRRTSQANATKRSSLASLSKLVGGPHSERSKLNQEEKPPSDVSERSKKKGRRLSRLMHFWKSRDREKMGTAASSERLAPE